MRSLKRFLTTPLLLAALLTTGVPVAYAGCLDNAGDVMWGFLSAGASVAACELAELVQAIKNFIQTVSQLANNVVNDAKQVADAAVAAVNSGAQEVKNAVSGAQGDLASDVSQGRALSSVAAMAPSPSVNLTAGASTRARAPTMRVAPGATQAAPKIGPNPMITVAPIQLAADPQRLHAALERGTQRLEALKSSVDQAAAGRINSAVQQALNQANSHLSDAANIVQTALLAPLKALQSTLSHLVAHPTELLDPIATINDMVNNISNSIVSTMSHINDVITQDAISTLQGLEPDVQKVQAAQQAGAALLSAMRRAHQERTQAALDALESQLNALAPQGGGIGQMRLMTVPATAFHFAPVQSKIHATLQQSVLHYQTVASNLNGSWAKIKAQHLSVRPRPLDLQKRQSAETRLDQLFRGKSSADVERARQDLLNQARARFGSDPKLMASIEQNLDSYLRTHRPAAVRAPVIVGPSPAAAPRGGIGVIRQ